MTQHLSLQDILLLRDRIALQADDAFRFELINANGLISALTTPFQVTFGIESFPTVIDKASALTFLLIANHPFRDGNKRIAGAALGLFLARNGLYLHANNNEMEAFTWMVMRSHLRDTRVTTWVAAHARPQPGPPAR